MSSSTRKRLLSGPAVRIKGVNFDSFAPQPYDFSYQTIGKQITVSEGHQWPPPKKGQTIDRGGPFHTTRSRLVSPTAMPYTKLRVPGQFAGSFHTYGGPIIPDIVAATHADISSSFPPTLESSDSLLNQKGATAISRCEPTKPVLSLSTAIGELMKDGLPSLVGSSLWSSRSLKARNAGSEYLGIQFGWLPLVSDVAKFSEGVINADKILAQYERDAGKVVRRQYYFPTESETTTQTMIDSSYPLGGETSLAIRSLGYGKVIRERHVFRKTWFSGAFTYHLPSDYDSRNALKRHAARANVLFGTDLTPETLWNLAPWSWAVDWFSNTGDVIANLETFLTDGLVMRFGYVMETTIVTDTWIHLDAGGNQHPNVTPIVLMTETKKRVQANPFGFGFAWEDLSPTQTSILAALGISRRR